MSNLSVFDFEGYQVRFVGTAEKPEWIAADVTAVLGIDRTQIRRLESYQKGVYIAHTPGGKQEMATVTEPGLYALIFTSRKESAKRFQKWVFSDVLPSIRKTGSYGTPQIQGAYWYMRNKVFLGDNEIPRGWWCIFLEINHLVMGLERQGYLLQPGIVPDISVGMGFCKHLRSLGYNTQDPAIIQTYPHHYPDGRVADANIYHARLLGVFREWFDMSYQPDRLYGYLSKKDPTSIPAMCKYLGLPLQLNFADGALLPMEQ